MTMLENHESLAVRHIGQLIEEKMSGFMDEVSQRIQALPTEDQQTPWYNLLQKDYALWEQPELDACYTFILDNHWKEKNIKPDPETIYRYLYGFIYLEGYNNQDAENGLRYWCDSDDRHISFEEAVAWSQTDECDAVVSEYIEDENAAWSSMPNPFYNPDPLRDFGGSYDGIEYDENESYTPAMDNRNAEYSFMNEWYFVVSQIKYIDSVAPGVTTPLKLQWLRIALVSLPVTELFGKKKTYEAGIKREQELVNEK